MDTFSIFDLS